MRVRASGAMTAATVSTSLAPATAAAYSVLRLVKMRPLCVGSAVLLSTVMMPGRRVGGVHRAHRGSAEYLPALHHPRAVSIPKGRGSSRGSLLGLSAMIMLVLLARYGELLENSWGGESVFSRLPVGYW